MILGHTVRANSRRGCLVSCLGHGHGNDSGWNSDDRIAQHHDHSGQELAQRSCRRNIAVSHGGQGDDGPIHRTWNTVKTTVGSRLDHIEQGTDEYHKEQHSCQKYRDLHPAGPQGFQDDPAFLEMINQLEHPEYTDHAQDPDRQKIMGAGQDQTDIGR